MTPASTPGPGIPLPRPTRYSAPFWDGCREGRLRYQRCPSGHVVFPPEAGCTRCLSPALEWLDAAGGGVVHSFTVVWRSPTPAFEAPYVIAVVECDEGFHLATNVIDCEVEDVAIGQRVQVEFVDVGEGFRLPLFRVVEEA